MDTLDTTDRRTAQWGEGAGTRADRNGMGTAALVVGVVGIVLAALLIFFPLAFVLGIAAVILGSVALRRIARGEATNRSHAITGLTCGLVAVVFSLYLGVRLSAFVIDNGDDFRRFWACITSAPTTAEQNACGRELARSLEDEELVRIG
jgi:hypothetical protein